MEFEEAVRKRIMIRRYDECKQISDEIIMKLIRKAHRAPSAGHTQVQEFIILKESVTKSKLRKAAVNQEYIEKARVFIVVCYNTSPYVAHYGRLAKEFYSIL